MSRRTLLALPVAGGILGYAAGRWWPAPAPQPARVAATEAGRLCYQASKLPDAAASGGQLVPGALKAYPNAPVTALPDPMPPGDMPLAQALARRRSIRSYSPRALTLAEVSWLLHAGAGVTQRGRDRQSSRRAAPSAGALYPIELYAALLNVEGAEPGIHHYDPWPHRLEAVAPLAGRDELVAAGLSQAALSQAAAVLALTGIAGRLEPKYGGRSQRYMLLEAGHISENIYLAATAMGLGVCGIGAFLDDDLNRLLGVDGQDEIALFLLAVGGR